MSQFRRFFPLRARDPMPGKVADIFAKVHRNVEEAEKVLSD